MKRLVTFILGGLFFKYGLNILDFIQVNIAQRFNLKNQQLELQMQKDLAYTSMEFPMTFVDEGDMYE